MGGADDWRGLWRSGRIQSLGKIIEGDIKGYPLTNAIIQDDLSVEMAFARVMDSVGLDASTADCAEAFRHPQYDLWHASPVAHFLAAYVGRVPSRGDSEEVSKRRRGEWLRRDVSSYRVLKMPFHAPSSPP